MQFVSMEHFSLVFSFLLREFDDWNASESVGRGKVES